jgi:hypothetical protein
MNFIKDYNKVPVFKKTFTPVLASATTDKYQDALDKVNQQYGNSKSESDKVTLTNLVKSINGIKEEEADGEVPATEASQTLKNLIAKHIGGRRKTRRSKRSKTRRSRK